MLAFVVACLAPGFAQEAPPLTAGRRIEGEIHQEDRVLEITVDGEGVEALVRSFRLDPREAGSGYVEFSAGYFDAFLIVRDADGVVVAEADGGAGITPDARVVLDAATLARARQLDACAVGGSGPFTLAFFEGEPPSLRILDDFEMRASRLEERVALLTGVEGRELLLAQALHLLGAVLLDLGRYPEAAKHLERAAVARTERLGAGHRRTVQSRRRWTEACFHSGRPVEGARMGEATLADAERSLGPEDPEVAQLLELLADMHVAAGRFAEGLALAERAVAIHENARPLDEEALGGALISAGIAHEFAGRWPEALEIFRRALAILEDALGPRHPNTNSALVRVGYALQMTGDLPGARRAFERCLDVSEEAYGDRHPSTAVIANELGGVLEAEGRFEEARRLYERSLRIGASVLDPNHPHMGTYTNNLALLLRKLKAYDEARRLYERAIEIWENSTGRESPEVALGLNNLALVHLLLGDPDEALALGQEALELDLRFYGPDHPSVAQTMDNLSTILDAVDEVEQAEALCREALDIYERVLGPGHRETLTTAFNLSITLHRQGRLQESLELLERVVAGRRQMLGSGREETSQSLATLALLLMDLGDLERAHRVALEALASREGELAAVFWTLSEAERLNLLSHLRSTLDVFQGVATLAGRPGSEIYDHVLRWKGVGSRTLALGRADLLSREDPSHDDALAELSAVQRELSKALHARAGRGGEKRARLLRALGQRRAALERELVRRVGLVGQATASSAQVAEALPAGSVLLDFFLHRNHAPLPPEAAGWKVRGSPAHLSAWVLRPRGTPFRVDLGPRVDIERLVSAHLEELVGRHPSGGRGVGTLHGPEDRISTTAAELRRLVWEPLAEHVEDAELVFVSPDGDLGALPFEVLRDEEGRFLVEDRGFVYLRDATLLPAIRAREDVGTGGVLFAVGNVDYDHRSFPAVASVPVGATRSFSRARSWPPLPATASEVDAIAAEHRAVFPERRRTVLTGAEATEERLKEEMAAAQVVHVATHGFFLRDLAEALEREPAEGAWFEESAIRSFPYPTLLTGLACAGAGLAPREGFDDGLLTAEELSWMDLRGVDLVVLSACETGLGPSTSGEGLLGLRRSFQQAGARTVISSLWSVGDEATRELMALFYRNLWREGMGKLEALRSAQLELLRANRAAGDPLPVTWGAFVLSGDWR